MAAGGRLFLRAAAIRKITAAYSPGTIRHHSDYRFRSGSIHYRND